jgi:hypothetical protein
VVRGGSRFTGAGRPVPLVSTPNRQIVNMSTTRRQQHTWNEPSPPPAVRWEYHRQPITNSNDANLVTLNWLGAEGWELVSVRAMHYWLKRRLA